MTIVNIHVGKTHLSEPVDQAALSAPDAPARRVLGALAGRFKLPPDYDAPLPDDEIDAFEGR